MATTGNEGAGLRLLNLDDDIQPTGDAVIIGGKQHHFKADDELTIADRENLMLFSLRLREIKELSEAGEDGLLPPEVEQRIVDMQRRVLKIALPTVSPTLIDELHPLKVHMAVDAFMHAIRIGSWIHRTLFEILMADQFSRSTTVGANRSKTTGASTDASASGTPETKPDSDVTTAAVTGDALTG